jgi:hypothetical protein
MATINDAWKAILDGLGHSGNVPDYFEVTAKQIREFTKGFAPNNTLTEPRILCKRDSRENLPPILKDNNLFILPIQNGKYCLVKGEGYVDIPKISSDQEQYDSKLDFKLETAHVGNSEMQHLDYAYATSIIRTFCEDPTLVLTIRGRKYTPEFEFKVENNPALINVKGVQTEVDAGFEGRNKVVLIEAKNGNTANIIIRQLFFPYRQWKMQTTKQVELLFFEKEKNKSIFNLWLYRFKDDYNYNSIELVKSGSLHIS